MNIHVKRKSQAHLECWIEVWDKHNFEWEVVAESKVIDSGNEFLIDEIYTKTNHRRKGYASEIVKYLKSIKPTYPIGITKTKEAISFWNKLKLEDALGKERDEEIENLMLENSTFDFQIKIPEGTS